MSAPSNSSPAPEAASTDERGGLRRGIDRALTLAFTVLLVAMIALGVAYVLTQAVGLIIVNPALVEGAPAVFEPILFPMATVFGIVTLLVAYARGWTSSE